MTVVWAASAKRELGRLDKPDQRNVEEAVARYAASGDGDVVSVKQRPGVRRLRIGGHRAFFVRVQGSTLQVISVRKREDAYRKRGR